MTVWLFADWLIDWLIDWLTDWLIDWLIDWLTVGSEHRAVPQGNPVLPGLQADAAERSAGSAGT